MNHPLAVDTLKALPKHRGWRANQALSLIEALDRSSFTRATDYAEAVTAAITGQRWAAVSGQEGYDTASTLARWLGARARRYRNPETLFDAKTQKDGIGYSDKVTEWANKATQFNELRATGKGVINGVVFHTPKGVFFQLGIDHHGTTPRFGTDKRPIIAPETLPQWIDGNGGFCPRLC
jgi:hypothetical protein